MKFLCPLSSLVWLDKSYCCVFDVLVSCVAVLYLNGLRVSGS